MHETDSEAAASPRSVVGRACDRDTLTRHLNDYLATRSFKDASHNGLQVSGTPSVSYVVAGVTANKALIDAAIAVGADAILVHHGLFWKGDDPRLVGYHRERIASLLAANINLYAYHLPLDVHPDVGNNARLGHRLGLTAIENTGENGLISIGQLGVGVAVKSTVLAAYCARHYGRGVTLYASSQRLVKKIAWCTGAGGSLLREAIEAGADAFITGEIAEQHIHEARESDVALIAAGHHATERDGVDALGAHVAKLFGVAYQFIDVDSPR